MPEEVRFFLRVAAYAAVVATVYWFVSFEPDGEPYRYDAAGTVLLAAAALSTAAIVLAVLVLVRAARGAPAAPGGGPGVVGLLNRVLGFDRGSEERDPQPLAGGPEAIPGSSAWPVLAGTAATLVALGLVFGAWLWAPGAVLGIGAVWGWLTQLD